MRSGCGNGNTIGIFIQSIPRKYLSYRFNYAMIAQKLLFDGKAKPARYARQRRRRAGICSAALIYGLDFIPVCAEKYDFLLQKDAYGLPVVRQWPETMQSAEFTDRLIKMGGYEFDHPGAVEEL